MFQCHYFRNTLTGLTLVAILSGCSPTIDHRGKLPEADQLKEIKIKQSTAEDVLRLIGSPTSTTQYGQKKWFYIYRKTSRTAFLNPDVVEENMVTIVFDAQDHVIDVIEKKPNGQDISHTSYRTPTYGHDRPILNKVFGNFGKTAKKADPNKRD